MSRALLAAERWAVVVANGMRPADVEAWIEALVGLLRCHRCGDELAPQPWHRATTHLVRGPSSAAPGTIRPRLRRLRYLARRSAPAGHRLWALLR